ncbi:hypothetical protein [Nevskia ramosa]|uniref:hypothetical protein n=1 Tax=Nevskia ramosa TaxID=64002 RepID=UPI003D136CA0
MMTSIISGLLKLALHLSMLSAFKMKHEGAYEQERDALRRDAGTGSGAMMMRIKLPGCARPRAAGAIGQGRVR